MHTVIMYSSHNNEVDVYPVKSSENGSIFCKEVGCNFNSHRIKQLRQHIMYAHEIPIDSKTLYFPTTLEFEEWKVKREQEEHFNYYLLSSKSNQSHNYYYCSLGKERVFLPGGRKKVTNQCTASLNVKTNQHTGQVSVDVINTHYGHYMPTGEEISDTVYTKTERSDIHKMIAKGYKKEQFEQELRKRGVSLDKIAHLAKEFDRIFFYRVYKHAEKVFTETSSVDNWSTLLDVNEKDGIIVHKQKGILLPKTTGSEWCGIENLAIGDFMFGLMSKKQQRTFLEFGKTIILEWVADSVPPIDAESSVFALYVLVLDNQGHDLPVGFCVTNNDNMKAVKCFFNGIKQFCGRVTTDFLILNNPKIYDIWKEVFVDKGQKVDYIISPWYTKNNFVKLLRQSRTPDHLSNQVHDLFTKILIETEKKRFYDLFPIMVKLLESDNTLINVFNHWSSELMSEPGSWAPCFFPLQLVSLKEASRIFHPNAVKRLHHFTRRRVGRCVYLIIQFQRHKVKKTPSLKAPGKKSNPFSLAPSLDRSLLSNRVGVNSEDGENVESDVGNESSILNICEEDINIELSLSNPRKRRRKGMDTKNVKFENAVTDTFNRTSPDEASSNDDSKAKDERSMEIVQTICSNLLNQIDSVSEAGLDIMIKKLKGVCEMFPSQDQEGNMIRPRVLKRVCETAKTSQAENNSLQLLSTKDSSTMLRSSQSSNVKIANNLTVKPSGRKGPISLSTSSRSNRNKRKPSLQPSSATNLFNDRNNIDIAEKTVISHLSELDADPKNICNVVKEEDIELWTIQEPYCHNVVIDPKSESPPFLPSQSYKPEQSKFESVVVETDATGSALSLPKASRSSPPQQLRQHIELSLSES